MPASAWEDAVLVRAATALARRAELEVVDALLESSNISVKCGDSWSDGFDDYVYDVHVTFTVAPNGSSTLTAAVERLRCVIGDALVLFVDAQGTARRGDLVRFDLVEAAAGVVDGERVERRRAALCKALQESNED